MFWRKYERLVEFFFLTVLFALLAFYSHIFKERTITVFVFDHLLALLAGLIFARLIYHYAK